MKTRKVMWSCYNCDGSGEINSGPGVHFDSTEEFRRHIIEVHNAPEDIHEGTREMQMHVDKKGGHITTWRCTIDGMEYYQVEEYE